MTRIVHSLVVSFLCVISLCSCGRSVNPNREALRLVKSLSPYFSDEKGTTNIVTLTAKDRLALTQRLTNDIRRDSGSNTALYFFTVDRDGTFSTIGDSPSIEFVLTSYGLTQTEITCVIDEIRHNWLTVESSLRDGTPEMAKYRNLTPASFKSHQAGRILNSTRYDVYGVTYVHADNRASQEIYQAAGCLILSPINMR